MIRATASSYLKHSIYSTHKIYFFILHYYFYKTPISIHLFYHLFYLNNNNFLIFYYIKQIITHMAHIPFSFFVVRKWRMREQPDEEREKKNKKNIYTMHHLHIFTSINVCIFWIKMYKIKYFLYFQNFCNHWCGCLHCHLQIYFSVPSFVDFFEPKY